MPKTIFGTTEKSNFILNMKDDTIEKLPLICVKLISILLLVGQAVPEVIEVVGILTNHGSDMSYGFLNTPFMCLAVVWVVGIIMLVIMGARGRINKRHHGVLIALLCVGIVWSIVSAVQSFSFYDAFNGLYGRTTGVLTLMSCATILLLLSCNSVETSLKDMVRFLVVASAVQCGWAVLQMLSRLNGDSSLFYYDDLNNIAVKNVCLPSGFSGSPIFFAEYLGLMLAIVLTLACLKRSKFYTVMCVVYAFFMVSTHTLVGWVGLAVVLVAVLVVVLVKKCKNVLPVVLCIVGGGLALGLSYICDGAYTLYDGAIIWQDSFYRLGTTGYYVQSTADFDIYSVTSVLSYVWDGCVRYLKIFPVFGTGSDCLIYAQLGTSDSISYVINGFDLAYNDYLQVAVTMGIPALVVYVASIVFCLVRLVKRFNDSDVFKGLFVAMVTYIVVSFICSTSIYVMPYVCVVLGLASSKRFNSISKDFDKG